jgi:hypothetical protein
MVKNYAVLFLFVSFFFLQGATSQEIKIFKVTDFDLKGKVKSCLVSTKYGKEEYEFNQEGWLVKSVTRYNDVDYDITYYKYSKGMLLEKRLENYRDSAFDESTSIANFYIIDSLSNLKITEKIVSYSKEFLDQYEYYYKNDSLRKIVRINNDGIDETLVSYSNLKGEQTKMFELNGVVQKTIRKSFKKEKDSIIETTVLTKKFLKGEPNSAIEEVFDGVGKLVLATKFIASTKTKRFSKEEIISYDYDEYGVLFQKEAKKESAAEVKEFIYQFDGKKNWVKEIITPDNTYTTRKIGYYETEEEVKQE